MDSVDPAPLSAQNIQEDWTESPASSPRIPKWWNTSHLSLSTSLFHTSLPHLPLPSLLTLLCQFFSLSFSPFLLFCLSITHLLLKTLHIVDFITWSRLHLNLSRGIYCLLDLKISEKKKSLCHFFISIGFWIIIFSILVSFLVSFFINAYGPKSKIALTFHYDS